MSRIVGFIPNRRFWILLAVIITLFVFAVPAFAQDTVPTEPITPDQAGALLMSAIAAIVAGGFGGAPITSFLVGLLKHVPALDNVSAPTLNLFVGGILTAAWWVASKFGFGVQFKSFTDFVLVVGPALLTLLTTMVGASTIHKAAAKEQLAVVGYKRS